MRYFLHASSPVEISDRVFISRQNCCILNYLLLHHTKKNITRRFEDINSILSRYNTIFYSLQLCSSVCKILFSPFEDKILYKLFVSFIYLIFCCDRKSDFIRTIFQVKTRLKIICNNYSTEY